MRVVTGKHSQMDEVASGTSVMSQSDLRLHFGLGQAKFVDLIEVKWPTTQKVEKFTHVEANQILTIRKTRASSRRRRSATEPGTSRQFLRAGVMGSTSVPKHF